MIKVIIDKILKNIFKEILEENRKNEIAKKLFNLKNIDESNDVISIIGNRWESITLSISSTNNNNLIIKSVPTDEFIKKHQTPIKTFNVKLGRFIGKLFDVDDKDREKYINLYKSKYDELKNVSKFSIVDGEDIKYWYNEDNYETGGGQLNKSCMRFSENQKQMDLYVKNSDKIKMLVLINKRNKLMGRALLWKLDYPFGKIYVDRVYTTKDSDIQRFKHYIEKRKWLSYETNEYDDRVIVLNDVWADEDPWMDSFRIFKYPEKHSSIFIHQDGDIVKSEQFKTKGILISKSNIFGFNPYNLIGKTGKQGIFKKFFKSKEKEHIFEKLMSFDKFIKSKLN